MANPKLVVANTDLDNLVSNLRGEIGEIITSWLLMRQFIVSAKRLETGEIEKDIKNRDARFGHLMADKLSDELVGRLSELAEEKVGQLTFYFASRKLGTLSDEAKLFTDFIIKKRIREKRNRDVSHKQIPEKMSDQKYLHIAYRVLIRAVALALRVMKLIDREVLGPSASYLWKEARKRRYEFLSPPRVSYMILPYLNLSSEDRIAIVEQELEAGKNPLETIQTTNRRPASHRRCLQAVGSDNSRRKSDRVGAISITRIDGNIISDRK